MERILVNAAAHPAALEFLKERGYMPIVILEQDVAGSYREAPDCVGVLANASLPFDDRFFGMTPRLRVLGRMGVGYDNVDVDAATRRGIRVVHTPLPVIEPVAEHTMMLILALVRAVVPADRDTRAGRFRQPSNLPGPELAGKTLGIIGLGRTGQRVAEIARLGFRMEIVYHDRFERTAVEAGLGARRMELDALFSESDFITLHVDLSPSTRHLIDGRALARMKQSAYLVNVARGPVIDERALVEALERGTIAGAALDVFETEPPDRLHPLFSLPNVVLTPHRAGFSAESVYGCSMVAEDIVRVLEGFEPRFPVN